MISALLIGLFVAFMLLGVPVALSIGAATIIAMLLAGYDLMLIPQSMAASTQSIPLLAVPYFILAANLMNALGATERIFRFALAVAGHRRGGLAYVNVVSNFLFSGISGAAVANAAGLGAILINAMSRAGYRPAFAAALSLSASTLGPIIPPSIMMVVYAITANVSIAELFVAGLLPGVLIAAALVVTVRVMIAFRAIAAPPPTRFSWAEFFHSAADGAPALVAPAIIFIGISSGTTTPTEAGVIAVVYTLGLGLLYRSLKLDVLMRVLRDTVEATAIIMYIVAVSSALSYVFISEGTSGLLTELIMQVSAGKVTFLLFANLVLLIIGCLMETLPALLIVVPMIMPVALAVGVDPVHLGVVIIFNLLIGIMTPPMGIGLYIMMAIGRLRLGELVQACLPLLATLIVALALLTFVPEISLFLPSLFFGR